MTKKTYISPQIEELNIQISHLLLGTGGNTKEEGGNEGGGGGIGEDDLATKELSGDFWSDEY